MGTETPRSATGHADTFLKKLVIRSGPATIQAPSPTRPNTSPSTTLVSAIT